MKTKPGAPLTRPLMGHPGGYKFSAGDVLKTTATYDNPTGKFLRDGAMGIAVGYFVPNDDAKMAALRRKSPPTHEMAGMSHDH